MLSADSCAAWAIPDALTRWPTGTRIHHDVVANSIGSHHPKSTIPILVFSQRQDTTHTILYQEGGLIYPTERLVSCWAVLWKVQPFPRRQTGLVVKTY